jgi:hypothetical protein
LPGEAALECQPFIRGSGFHMAHTDAADNEARLLDCLLQSWCGDDPHRRVPCHVGPDRAHQLGALAINIVKRYFVDANAGMKESMKQQRSPEAAPQNTNFHVWASS